jgi:sarcosine oxidase
LWREIEAATGKTILQTTGGLIIAASTARTPIHGSNGFLEQTIRCAKKFGIGHSLLDTNQIRSRFPQFNLMGGEQGYYEPMMGFLRPELCIESQLLLAEKHGAEIRKNQKVLELIPASREVRIRTSAGHYTAEKVVVSAGSWITQLLEQEFVRNFKVYRQVLYWFGVKDSIQPYLPERFPVFIWEFGKHQDDFIYGFPAIDGLRGGVKVASEQHAFHTNPDIVDREVGDEEIDAMYRDYVRDRLPGLTSECVKATACLYTSTADSGFVIDFHPLHPNVLIVSPCSGHGFKHSAAIGEVVADLAITGQSRMDISKFKMDRFAKS